MNFPKITQEYSGGRYATCPSAFKNFAFLPDTAAAPRSASSVGAAVLVTMATSLAWTLSNFF